MKKISAICHQKAIKLIQEHEASLRSQISNLINNSRAFSIDDLKDIHQEGLTEAFMAALKYDHQRGVPFLAYVRPYLKKAVYRAMRDLSGPITITEYGHRNFVQPFQYIRDQEIIGHQNDIHLRIDVNNILRDLPQQEQDLLNKRYGLINGQRTTFKELGKDLGKSSAAVHKQFQKLIRTLRWRLTN